MKWFTFQKRHESICFSPQLKIEQDFGFFGLWLGNWSRRRKTEFKPVLFLLDKKKLSTQDRYLYVPLKQIFFKFPLLLQ